MSSTLISKSIEVLGSVIEIKLQNRRENLDLISSCFSELQRIDKTYSRFRVDSQLSKVNAALGEWHAVSDEFLFLVQKVKEFNKKTNGEFDATVKSDLERLGYDSSYSFKEKERTRQNVLSRLKTKLLEPIVIDMHAKRIKLRRQIEFGGFGKGMALDKVANILEKGGVTHYYINAGGDIYAKKGEWQKPWEILLEHPDDVTRAIGKVVLDGQAIACSAPNRRKWTTPEGKTHHHLINAKTRLPQNSVKSIFVFADTGIEADGYATALFAAGFKRAIALSKKLPVKILIVSSENKMFVSDGLEVELYK